jgi:hypothetical protein
MASYDAEGSSSALVLSGADYEITAIEAEAESSATADGSASGHFIYLVSGESSGNVSSSASAPQVFDMLALSELQVTVGVSVIKEIHAAIQSGMSVSAVIAAAAEYYLSVESLAYISSVAEFISNYFDGWAYNLNTEAAAFYEQYRFNSFARNGNNYYGMNEDGIHVLTGDTDNGEDIDAMITLPKTDFGQKALKTIPEVFASASSEREMKLTSRVDEYPDYDYTFIGKPGVLAPVRVKLGRGLKGRMWQLEIKNKEGAYMEIDALDIPVTALSRMV